MSRVRQLVTAARAGIENLSPDDLAAELAGGGVLLVDVREAPEAAGGSVEGAVVVPRGLLEFCVALGEPGRRVVVVSAAGRRSALAAQALQSLGVRDVAHLAGGLRRWVAEGRPLVPVGAGAGPAGAGGRT